MTVARLFIKKTQVFGGEIRMIAGVVLILILMMEIF